MAEGLTGGRSNGQSISNWLFGEVKFAKPAHIALCDVARRLQDGCGPEVRMDLHEREAIVDEMSLVMGVFFMSSY
jgi:hypothetical protein